MVFGDLDLSKIVGFGELSFKEFRFKKVSDAKKKQAQIKKIFGFKPKILRERDLNTGKVRFVVVQSTKMTRLNSI